MPNSLAHYAIAAAGLKPLGVQRRELALASLWSVAPDLDVIPAVAWSLAAPHVPVSSDMLLVGAHLFSHRGFSHTFSAALLVAGLVWWIVDRRQGLLAGLAWAIHVGADMLTTWSTRPFWPVSDLSVQFPLVTGVDPLLTIVSAGTVVALLGPLLAARLEWPGAGKRASFERWGRRWGQPLAYASIGAIALSTLTVAWGMTASPDATVLPGHTPITVGLDEVPEAQTEAWNVTTRWLPMQEGTTRQIPYVANMSEQAPSDIAQAGECALEALGPYAPIDDPFWELSVHEVGWSLIGRDLVRNATGTGGGALQVLIEDGQPRRAWVFGGDAKDPRFRLQLPSVLLEDAACP